jgi:hypothetical protein
MSTAALICDTGALLDYLVATAPGHRPFRETIDRSRARYVPGLCSPRSTTSFARSSGTRCALSCATLRAERSRTPQPLSPSWGERWTSTADMPISASASWMHRWSLSPRNWACTAGHSRLAPLQRGQAPRRARLRAGGPSAAFRASREVTPPQAVAATLADPVDRREKIPVSGPPTAAGLWTTWDGPVGYFPVLTMG